MNKENGKWLAQKLSQIGYTVQDLSEQTGISLSSLQKMLESNEGTQEEWDLILNVLQAYPALYYPSDEILDQLDALKEQGMADEMMRVYYGVNQSQLIFCVCKNEATGEIYGANVPTELLKSLMMSVADASSLFTAQKDALANASMKA